MKRTLISLFVLIGAASAFSPAAYACDGGRMTADLTWCIRDGGANSPNAYGDIIVGACNKDADKLRSGFRTCQSNSGPRDNYDSCPAGQQIDTARAVGQTWHVFQPGKCGF